MSQLSVKGLAKAQQIYEDRQVYVRDVKAKGRKVMGYLCAYPALEMLTALDILPCRVLGNMHEPITKADAQVPAIICPMLRSMLDLGLKGKYGFLDGFVGAHSCDCGGSFCHLWDYNMKLPYHHFIDLPHVVHEDSFGFFKEGLKLFQKTLEEYMGKKIDPDRLKEEIRTHNRQRALVRQLYDLRKPTPPLLSGAENLKVVLALLCSPIEEGSRMLEEVIEQVKTRTDGPRKKGARLMLWGTPLTEVGLVEMMESLDANVVMDDICTGSRHFWDDVEITEDPLDGLAKRYLEDIKCPRTFRESQETYEQEQDCRFGYLLDYARDWKVDGVILQSMRYCDTHGYEVPTLKAFLDRQGLPNIYLEHEYSMVAEAPLKTRVEAFLEMIA